MNDTTWLIILTIVNSIVYILAMLRGKIDDRINITTCFLSMLSFGIFIGVYLVRYGYGH